ncbi:hypothetical protein HK102_009513, partial [Quaeritorhiza haematococci]
MNRDATELPTAGFALLAETTLAEGANEDVIAAAEAKLSADEKDAVKRDDLG